MDDTALPRTSPGSDGPAEVRPAVDPREDTVPQPAVIGPFPAEPHTPALHGHPHTAPIAPAAMPHHGAPLRFGAGAVVAGVVAIILAAGVVTAYALTRTPAGPTAGASSGATGSTDLDASGAPVGAPLSASAVPMLAASQPTLVLGDSLALTVYPWLADLLPDRYVSYEAEVGRSTAWAARTLAGLGSIPPVVIISIGTNDELATDVESGARTILDLLGPQRCVVWVDIERPDRVGDPKSDLNAALARASAGRRNVSILRWTDAVAAHPAWLSGDGIHATELGAQARAEAFAAASAGCSPLDPEAPRARRQFLASSVFYGPLAGQGGTRTASSGGTASPSGTASATASRTPSPTSTPSSPLSGGPTPSPTTPGPEPTPTADPPSSTPPPPTSAAPEPPAGSPAADPSTAG